MPYNIYDPTNPNNLMHSRFMQGLQELNKEYVQYIAENGPNSCEECRKNHKLIFEKNDPNKPNLPIHPNCKCKYLDISNHQEYKSLTLRVGNAPSFGGIVINSKNEMLKAVESRFEENALKELIIINHGEISGEFELGSKSERFDLMTDNQVKRLKTILSNDAIVDLRMCYGIKDPDGEKVAQKLANQLQCRIKAYASEVSPLGTRVFRSKDQSMLFWQRTFIGCKSKIFYPQK